MKPILSCHKVKMKKSTRFLPRGFILTNSPRVCEFDWESFVFCLSWAIRNILKSCIICSSMSRAHVKWYCEGQISQGSQMAKTRPKIGRKEKNDHVNLEKIRAWRKMNLTLSFIWFWRRRVRRIRWRVENMWFWTSRGSRRPQSYSTFSWRTRYTFAEFEGLHLISSVKITKPYYRPL